MNIFSWFTIKSIQWFARSIAKTQLNTLCRIQSRQPSLLGGFLYEQVLLMRPFYNLEKVREIIQKAQRSFASTPEYRKTEDQKKYGFGFRDIVSELIIEEYFKNQGTQSIKDGAMAVTIILITVKEVIPADI